MPKIKIRRTTGPTEAGTGKNKSLQVEVWNKKGGTTFTRSVSKDAGKKTTERSVIRHLRQGSSVKKTKEDGVKTKTYRTGVDRDGGKAYEGTDRKMFKAANKLNKVIEKRGRAADIYRSNLMSDYSPGKAKKEPLTPGFDEGALINSLYNMRKKSSPARLQSSPERLQRYDVKVNKPKKKKP